MRNLYFIAVIPDNPVRNELMEFKYIAKEKFGSGKSLNSPPHITMIPPFRCDRNDEKMILSSLKALVKSSEEFYITLNGFNRFGNKVIFVDVEKNKELQKLRDKTYEEIRKIIRLPGSYDKFHPHITVAFRDLKKEVFPRAWNYFSKIEYYRVFKFTDISLLRHNGYKWKAV